MLQRKTPLRSNPTKSLSRRPLRRTSKKQRQSIEDRRAAVIADGPREPVVDGPDHAFRKWIAELVCVVKLGRETDRVVAAHFRCKRRSGDWYLDPNSGERRGNIMPLSDGEHGQQHARGIETFAKSCALDIDAVCSLIGQAYCEGWTSFALSAEARGAGGYLRVDLANPSIDPTTESP